MKSNYLNYHGEEAQEKPPGLKEKFPVTIYVEKARVLGSNLTRFRPR